MRDCCRRRSRPWRKPQGRSEAAILARADLNDPADLSRETADEPQAEPLLHNSKWRARPLVLDDEAKAVAVLTQTNVHHGA